MKTKALVVDDHFLDAELTQQALRLCDCNVEVVVVSDGEQALQALHCDHDFDLILLDLALPKVDGFEVLKELSSKPFLSDIPIIVLSGSRSGSDQVRTRMLGASGFVEKSIDFSAFQGDLARILTRQGLGGHAGA
ncbi:response regulator [Massilia sp. IC2-476]|uniref:response regulator n=1 Tax=Massilia sp. IC2-476 TaxID=2887199 RepID=UPI001D11742F|nr:response regulator [Massilia sp. IC2-476]MCC2972317.1 response regulator [Massilia sp. IC2-476]